MRCGTNLAYAPRQRSGNEPAIGKAVPRRARLRAAPRLLMSEGGFYHDGRFATVRDVVEHYDKFLRLSLSEAEKTDLVDYLLSL